MSPAGEAGTSEIAVFRPDMLAGRVALVTGGGTGIGLGIASCLASAGATVAIASRKPEHLEPAAAQLRARGARVSAVETNVREPEAVARMVDRVTSEHGRLDILVNNAAGNFYAPSSSLSPNAWRAVVETDLYGSFYCAQAVHPVMKAQGGGRIISISMTLHYRGWPLMAHATAAKAGVDALTRTLALEWAPDRITVNAVAPGPIPTEGVRSALHAAGWPRPRCVPHGPVRRPGDPARPVGDAGRRGTDGEPFSPGRRASGSPARSSWWTAARGSRAGGAEMFLGHYGAALALKRVEPKVSLGTLFVATQLADLLWGAFLLLGWEHVRILPDDNPLLVLQFYDYPISHSLVGALGWGVAAAAIYYSWPTRDTTRHWQAAALVGAAVASHWLLDLVVHLPDLPLAGNDSPKLGLGLWRHFGLSVGARAARTGRRRDRLCPRTLAPPSRSGRCGSAWCCCSWSACTRRPCWVRRRRASPPSA